MPLANTVNDLITIAYRSVNITQQGQTPDANQLAFGLAHYNLMMANFVGMGIDTWPRATLSKALSAGTASYTIGPSGAIVASRPIMVLNVYKSNGTTDSPLYEMSKREYFKLASKTTAGTPLYYFYDQGFASATAPGTIYIYPVPANADLPLTLYVDVRTSFTPSTSPATDKPLCPDEWQDAVMWNLAVRILQHTGRPVPQEIMFLAQTALRNASGLDVEEAKLMPHPDYASQDQMNPADQNRVKKT